MGKVLNTIAGAVVSLGLVGCGSYKTNCSGRDLIAGFSGAPVWGGNMTPFIEDIAEKGGIDSCVTSNSLVSYRNLLPCAQETYRNGNEVYATAFSQGCEGAILFCQELERQGIEVEKLILVDSTYTRSLPFGDQRIPSNVLETIVYRNLGDADNFCRGNPLCASDFRDPNDYDNRYREIRFEGTHWGVSENEELKSMIMNEIE